MYVFLRRKAVRISKSHPLPKRTAMANPTHRDQVFFSYSRKDKKWLELFQTSLKSLIRANQFSVWDDTKIEAGDVWRDEIKRALASAKVAVLLVSRNFLASDFIADNELPPLLEAADNEGLKILLVIVGHSLFEETDLGRYQAVNDPARPLAGISAANREKEVVRICKVIRDAVSEDSSKIVNHSGDSSEIVNHVEEAHHVIKSGPPPIIHKLRFFLLQDRRVRPLPDGDAFEMEFRLLNSSSPPSELNNVFGHYWVMGAHIIGATIPPARGEVEGGRVEWDIQIPVFPKGGVFLPAKIAARMPELGSEVLVGAQIVSRETSPSEYLWGIVNDNGVPTIVFKKSPPELQ